MKSFPGTSEARDVFGSAGRIVWIATDQSLIEKKKPVIFWNYGPDQLAGGDAGI